MIFMVYLGFMMTWVEEFHSPFMINVFKFISPYQTGFQIWWISTSRSFVLSNIQNEIYFFLRLLLYISQLFQITKQNKQFTKIVVCLIFLSSDIVGKPVSQKNSVENSLKIFWGWWDLRSMTVTPVRYFIVSLHHCE